MQRHTCSQSDISTGSQFCPTIHLGVFLNFHSPQQLFKTFSTLLKLPTPPTSVPSLSACVFASYLMGKIEIAEREITQLPAITLTNFHHKCIHPFLFAICLIQEVTLLQPKFSSLPQALYLPTSYLLWVLTSLWPLLPVSSLPSLSSCLCQLAFKHAHTENRDKSENHQSSLPFQLSSPFFFLG